MRYQSILFDLDGTLVNSLRDIANAVNHARAELNLEALPESAVRGFVGDGVTMLIARAFPEALRKQAHDIFGAHYAAHLTDCTESYPCVEETLVLLRYDGLKLGVVTNKPTDFSETILKNLGLRQYFGAVVGGDAPVPRKPAPDALLLALKQMGHDGPAASVLMVGDGRNDVLAAKAAGMDCAAVSYGFGDVTELRDLGAKYVINDMEAVLGLYLDR